MSAAPLNNRVITNSEYKSGGFQSKTGSISCPNDFWDCESYCDHALTRKNLGIKGKILHVLVLMRDDPNFRNVSNKAIKYQYPVFVDADLDGARKSDSKSSFGSHWVTDHPIGDAIIVVANSDKIKAKKAKKLAEKEPEVVEKLEW
jgi:hypothetical protein